jgi:hypothetical protein
MRMSKYGIVLGFGLLAVGGAGCTVLAAEEAPH